MAKIKDNLTGEEKEKSVTEFSAQPEELTSAAAYGQRVAAKREATQKAKAFKRPLGGADPIPEGKLQPLVDAARTVSMPQPDWFQAPEDGPTDTELENWAPAPVSRGPSIEEVVSTSPRPLSMKEARAEAARRREEAEELRRKAEEAMRLAEEAEKQDIPSAQEELEEAEAELVQQNPFNMFDPAAYGSAQMPLLDPKRKKAIESRLTPLEIGDLITKREIQQYVDVVPGKFSLKLRTVREKEHLWILQYLYEETGVTSAARSDELNSVCRLVCAIMEINGRPLPEHRDNVGLVDEGINKEKFKRKLDIVLGFPMQIVADFGVQYNWFSDRVTALFSLDQLKNG